MGQSVGSVASNLRRRTIT